MKFVFLLFTFFNIVYGYTDCNLKQFILQSGEFNHKIIKTKVFNYKTREYDIKLKDTSTIWPKNCIIESEKLYMYSYRSDLKDRILIQFIFNKATGNSSFDTLADNLIYSETFKKAAQKTIKKNKKLIIEVSAYHYERIYEYKKGKIFYLKTNGDGISLK